MNIMARYSEAYSLGEKDGTLCRAFRSLALAKDEEGFLRFLDEQSRRRSGLFDLLDEDDVFAEMREFYFYDELRRTRANNALEATALSVSFSWSWIH
jgi:hypothetical protein